MPPSQSQYQLCLSVIARMVGQHKLAFVKFIGICCDAELFRINAEVLTPIRAISSSVLLLIVGLRSSARNSFALQQNHYRRLLGATRCYPTAASRSLYLHPAFQYGP